MGGSARPAPPCLTMQLREYPLIRFRDLRNWPPVWLRLGRVNAKAAKTLTGEIGILKEARCHEDRQGRIYMTVAYNGVRPQLHTGSIGSVPVSIKSLALYLPAPPSMSFL